jgi:hypothetical protein
MTGRRQVRIPACRRAEDELQAASVARGHGAAEIACAECDFLPAHRAHREGVVGHLVDKGSRKWIVVVDGDTMI